MKSIRTSTLAVLGVALAVGNIGCVRGMTYKMPMPDSMTLGTIKDHDAALASTKTTPTTRQVARATQ